MTLAVNPSNSLNVTTPDEAAIETIVESVANLADRGNFESLEKLYAQEVEVDYTSAFGGEVELKSPQLSMAKSNYFANITTLLSSNMPLV